jgi:hypothetical protein
MMLGLFEAKQVASLRLAEITSDMNISLLVP